MRQVILACLGMMWGFILTGCGPQPTSSTVPISNHEDVLVLVRAHCGSCHQVPSPSLVPKDIWQSHILPSMGAMLGHYDSGDPDYQRAALLGFAGEARMLEAAKVFPKQPAISSSAWEDIKAYYMTQAPAILVDSARLDIDTTLALFQPMPSSLRLSPPSSTLLQFSRNGGLYLGDANSQRLYVLGVDGNIQQAANVKEGAVHLQEAADALYLTVMGSFSPTDQGTGFIMRLPTQSDQRVRVVLDGLKRPVHSQLADLNGDGRTDILVCEYAKWTGQLNWYAQQDDGRFVRHTLRDRPGATRAYVEDTDQDGDLDIVALMAQGDEGIFRYENDGQGHFKETALLQFPPSYGSSYFALQDLNGDSLPDIVYTNGDNADYTPILKPYHGIRLYLNQGNWQFVQRAFIPMHGAYKAIPADYDQDGDLDIAAISFFPDYATRAEESFVYWENTGDFQYEGHTWGGASQGRWLTMTAGDLDQDGDLDLALGSLTFDVPGDSTWVSQWVAGQVPYVLLTNRLNE